MVKEFAFENVLIVGPSSQRRGGIASVIKMYKKHINAEYFASTNVQNTFLSFLFFPIRLIVFIKILIFNKKIKIVHIHGSSDGSFYRKYVIYLISKIFKKKIIYHLHSGRFNKFYDKSNKLLKSRIIKVINNADHIIVLSEFWKTYVFKEFTPKKISVLGNMISKPKPAIKQVNEEVSKVLTFAYLGKLFQPKGVYDLLDCIFENYNKLDSKAIFIFAGTGDEDKTIKYIQKDKKNLVKFVGWLDENEKNKLLIKMDVLMLPSYSEGMPVSVLEAMSYRKGVIATHVGGIPEILIDNVNGKVVTPGSKKEIYEAIKYYIKKPHDIKNHGDKGYKIAQSYFPETIVDNLKSIYNSITI